MRVEKDRNLERRRGKYERRTRREKRWKAMSEEEGKENTRACIAAAKIIGEALLRKMREEYKT